jgi:hypothetical protein
VAENRVLIGLPERLDKAKKQIAQLEQREELIRAVLRDPPNDPLVEIEKILDGSIE